MMFLRPTSNLNKLTTFVRCLCRQHFVNSHGDHAKWTYPTSSGARQIGSHLNQAEGPSSLTVVRTSGSCHDRYDFVVFGASGVTGQYVVEELSKVTRKQGSKFTMAVAGRNEEKLRDVLKRVSIYTGNNLSTTPILIADTNDPRSLTEMCNHTKVLLNCVGPYYIHGEPVIKACIETGTHQLDVSGEPLYLESAQLNYDEEAKRSGVYIVGGCGAPSALSDLGAHFTRKKFRGEVNSIDSYIKLSGTKGLCFNVTTLICALHGFETNAELKEQRKHFHQHTGNYEYKRKTRKKWFHSDAGLWCVQWPGCDRSVIIRTMRNDLYVNTLTPIGVHFCLDSFYYMMLTLFYGYLNMTFARHSLLREIISKNPRIFTNGKFRSGGPTREQVQQSSFSVTFIAEGWSDNVADHETPPDQLLITRFSGPEVAYVSSAICLVQCGITLLGEKDKLPDIGGVYTIASAFANTMLIERLNENNVKLEVVKPLDI